MIAVRKSATEIELSDSLMVQGDPVDLTDSTVVLVISGPLGATQHATTIDDDPTTGKVTCTLSPSNFPTAGHYYYEWKVTGTDLVDIVLPEAGPRPIRSIETLG